MAPPQGIIKFMATPMHPNPRDREQVKVMTACGASEEHVAAHLSLSVEDLKTYYRKEITYGVEEANMKVAKTFYELAVSGENPNLTLAWMRMRAGWKDAAVNSKPEEENLDAELTRNKLLKLLNRGKESAA